MNIEYDIMLNMFPTTQGVDFQLDSIKNICRIYNQEFTLVVTDKSLRKGFEPSNVKLTDIKVTSRAAELADRVVYKSPTGFNFILKEK